MFAWAGATPASADPSAATDDRSVAVRTGSWWFTGLNAVAVQQQLTAHNARLTRIAYDLGSSPETFTVTMVSNLGAYKVATSWWSVDRTLAQLTNDLSANSARLIYLDAYDTAAGERFAAVMVPDAGLTQRSWWWYADTDPTTIQNNLNAHGARLAEVKSYLISGTEYFLAIMVLQTGIDAKNWTWSLNVTPATIQSQLDSFHYRLLSLERNPFGGFDAVLVQSYGEGWWWAVDLTQSGVTSQLSQHGARITNIARYTVSGATKFAIVMVDNTNLESVPINAETTRIIQAMAPGLVPGDYGFYLRQVGGSALVGLDENFRFEPASAIKVLYLLYAIMQVQAGNDSLGSQFTYYPNPADPTNPGVCPDPAWETPGNAQHTTLDAALTAMMTVSDNRMTRGMALRYGMANVAAFAASLGLTHTHLNQDRIGCLFVNGVRNELSLVDAARLYEQVETGPLLTAASRTSFYHHMLGGPVPSASHLGDVVRQEAAKQGKSSSAAAFIAQMSYREKAGNEFQCVSSNCATNSQYLDFTAVAGRIVLPVKSGGNTIPTSYLYGRYANDFIDPCLPGSGCPLDTRITDVISTLGTRGSETYRAAIANALTTW